jgi:hypothetical protein
MHAITLTDRCSSGCSCAQQSGTSAWPIKAKRLRWYFKLDLKQPTIEASTRVRSTARLELSPQCLQEPALTATAVGRTQLAAGYFQHSLPVHETSTVLSSAPFVLLQKPVDIRGRVNVYQTEIR